MADEKTHGDTIREYLTGASSAGGVQTDPDASLGSYRSSTLVGGLTAVVAGGPSNITVDFVAPYNGVGAGSLAATGNDTLTWTPPGGSVGSAVTILNGETKLIEGSTISKFVRVTRTSATNLTGTATVTLTLPYNNAIGHDNVSSAEATAGETDYRCICAKNDGSISVQDYKRWIGTIGTDATSDGAQLGASGAGSITTSSDSFADWPESGGAHIKTSAGATREIVYYSSRTDTTLTVPAAGRELLGTSAGAGASDDEIQSVPLIAIALEWGIIEDVAFTGSGLDDATSGGTYKKVTDQKIRVQIDGTGTPDTFKWSNDEGSTWESETVAITGSAQTLENGITITFAATTGHTSGDRWDFNALAACQEIVDEDTPPDGLSFDTGTTAATGLDIGTLASDEQVFIWQMREIPAGAQPIVSLANHVNGSFEAA